MLEVRDKLAGDLDAKWPRPLRVCVHRDEEGHIRNLHGGSWVTWGQ